MSRREQRWNRREQKGEMVAEETPKRNEQPEVKLTKQRNTLEKKIRDMRKQEEQLHADEKKKGFLSKLLGGKTQEEKKVEQQVVEQEKKLSELEVNKFHQENNRPPTENELDELAGNIYDQLKEEPKTENTQELETKMGLSKEVKTEDIRGKESRTDKRGKRSLIQVVEEEKGKPALEVPGTVPVQGQEISEEDARLTPRERFLKRRAERMNQLVEEKTNALEVGKEQPRSRRRRNENIETVKEQPVESKKTQGKKAPPVSAIEEETENISMKELLAAGEEKEESEEDFELNDLEGESEGELTDLESMEEEQPGVCANCKKKTEQSVYCSKCGFAFCEKCASGKETLNDKIKLICPKCKTRVSV